VFKSFAFFISVNSSDNTDVRTGLYNRVPRVLLDLGRTLGSGALFQFHTHNYPNILDWLTSHVNYDYEPNIFISVLVGPG
jgi:hypothetical protein